MTSIATSNNIVFDPLSRPPTPYPTLDNSQFKQGQITVSTPLVDMTITVTDYDCKDPNQCTTVKVNLEALPIRSFPFSSLNWKRDSSSSNPAFNQRLLCSPPLDFRGRADYRSRSWSGNGFDFEDTRSEENEWVPMLDECESNQNNNMLRNEKRRKENFQLLSSKLPFPNGKRNEARTKMLAILAKRNSSSDVAAMMEAMKPLSPSHPLTRTVATKGIPRRGENVRVETNAIPSESKVEDKAPLSTSCEAKSSIEETLNDETATLVDISEMESALCDDSDIGSLATQGSLLPFKREEEKSLINVEICEREVHEWEDDCDWETDSDCETIHPSNFKEDTRSEAGEEEDLTNSFQFLKNSIEISSSHQDVMLGDVWPEAPRDLCEDDEDDDENSRWEMMDLTIFQPFN